MRDGLKPVHRRILYAMNESGIYPNRPFLLRAGVQRFCALPGGFSRLRVRRSLFRGGQTGSVIVNRLPCPIWLSTPIVPPCASTNSFEIASPRPLPCTFVPGTRK